MDCYLSSSDTKKFIFSLSIRTVGRFRQLHDESQLFNLSEWETQEQGGWQY